MRKFFFVCFLFLFFSCQSFHHDSSTLIVGVESFPENLDPRLATDALSAKISALVYPGLFVMGTNMRPMPSVAESYKFISDTVLSVHIKKNLVFHNGKHLTVQDVLKTYQSVIDPHLHSPLAGTLEVIDRIESVSEDEIKIILKRPFAPIITVLTLGILPESVAAQGFLPIGCGPYQIEEVIDRQKIVLKRFENYRLGEKPKTNRLVFKTFWDDTVRVLEFLKGRIDLMQNAAPLTLIPAIEKGTKNNKPNVLEEAGINFSYLGFNLKDPILSHSLVRKAIAHAINRDDIIRYKLMGKASPATSLLFPGHWAFNASLEPFDYNPEKAKKLLDEAGYPDPEGEVPRFKLVYKTSAKKDRVELALLIADYLRAVGIEVEVSSYEWGTFFRDIKNGNFQMFSLTWVGVTEPDIYYYAFHSSQIPPIGANRIFYYNPTLDLFLEQGRTTLDENKRREIYGQVQKIIYDDFVYVPLWYENNVVAVQENVVGYTLRPDAGFQNLVNTFVAE